ncbi:L,D-transpeptidase [Streptomyces sp. MB09-02B]|uniref:L,D-transpeptidase n=1 Tax=Streptomyces sp. MB09-02B TaxID=3028667 RepID=UPI0029AFBE02|nr:L,D-transpeptidase [Streptomyces sp. MB09-02B]MDX3640741.1 L,D-transpeptidase [Streptomyces sp. MB09-02B]
MRMTKRVAVAGSVLALGGFIAGLTPAQAAPSGAQAKSTYYFKFDKSTNTNSRLYLIERRPEKPERAIATWRAGSGHGTDSCKKNVGWLPNGKYKIKKYNTTYNGSLIKGYAFALENKKCSNGTNRTELFIHSEMKQNGNAGNTEATRWDGDNDYKSAGCIKLKPADIKAVYKKAKSVGFPTQLTVVS